MVADPLRDILKIAVVNRYAPNAPVAVGFVRGFGLHSGAVMAKELGGSLIAHSDGPGKGACFTLEFPCEPDKHSESVSRRN